MIKKHLILLELKRGLAQMIVIKRDGRKVEFDLSKIISATSKAVVSAGTGIGIPKKVADMVLETLQVSIVSIQADQSRQLPLGSQSWRGSQRLNGGTYFFNRKMIKIYTVNLYKI